MICKTCQIDKPESDYRKGKRSCKRCFKKRPSQLYGRKFQRHSENHRRRFGGGNMTGRLFRKVWEQHDCCFYCGSKDSLQFDHIMPKTLGGRNDLGNVTIACKKCNNRKSDRHPLEFIQNG